MLFIRNINQPDPHLCDLEKQNDKNMFEIIMKIKKNTIPFKTFKFRREKLCLFLQ